MGRDMTTITIVPENPGSPATTYRAVADGLESVGQTAGAALDGMLAKLGPNTTCALVVVQKGAGAAGRIADQLPQPPKQANGESWEDLVDHDFLKTYAHEADDSVNLETVRQAMAKIPGRLADDIRAERDER
jgi:hypothetical protein